MARLTQTALAVILLLSSVCRAQFFDLGGRALKNVADLTDPRIGWRPISASNGDFYKGIGALTAMPNRDGYFCSASLIASSLEEFAPVYILTNGHCLALERFLGSPKLVIKDEKPSGSDFFL